MSSMQSCHTNSYSLFYYGGSKKVKLFFILLWIVLSNGLFIEALVGPIPNILRPSSSSTTIQHQQYCLSTFSSLSTPSPTITRWKDGMIQLTVGETQKPRMTRTKTHLSMMTVTSSSSTLAAASCLGLSSSIGYRLDSNVVTLMTASILSNFVFSGIVPTTHFLYDACWTRFLPMSLALTLLKPPKKQPSSMNTPTNNDDGSSVALVTPKVKQAVKRVGLAFGVASIGSILGCIASFYLLPKGSSLSSSILAGCLCASFIGGTVNFFSTARFFSTTINHNQEMTSLLTSMATADVLIMAFYFTIQSFATQSTILKKIFFTTTENNKHDSDKDSGVEPNVSKLDIQSDPVKQQLTRKKHTPWMHRVTSGFKAIILSSLLVDVASRLETIVTKWTRLPGTACAIIAFGATFLRRWTKGGSESERVYSILSDLGLHLLFAAIGATANIKTATLYYGPYTLAFGTLALITHIVFTFFSSYLLNNNKWKRSHLSLQQIIIASNAAIGGPATAAAFASNIKECDEDDKSALVLAATFWGVTGYALGTTIGVLLTKLLHQ